MRVLVCTLNKALEREGNMNAIVAPPADSVKRMAQLRELVHGGMTVYEAAQEIGVDPVIAQLWLRLPDLWATEERAPTPIPAMLPGVLRRMIVCNVPVPACDQLRSSGKPILQAAADALCAGLSQPLPEQAKGKFLVSRRPLAVPVPAEACRQLLKLAEKHFGGDYHRAGGWAIARGVGMNIPLPAEDELANEPVLTFRGVPEPFIPRPPIVAPPRRGQREQRAPLPADDSVPNGDELRRMRENLGLSQRDLAGASGMSRGFVCELERGRRRHVLSRRLLADILERIASEREARRNKK